jgi:Holliday junction resolvase RusA-like endonuclease
MAKITFKIDYIPPNWNEYINIERTNYFKANKLKQEEKRIVKYSTIGIKYQGEYPIEIKFRVHFKDYRQDLDNARIKGVVDGLVTAGVIKNDNLKCIQRITLEPVFDNQGGIEVEIGEINGDKNY